MKSYTMSHSQLLTMTAVFYAVLGVITLLITYYNSIDWRSWFHIYPVSILVSALIAAAAAYLMLKLESYIGFTHTQLGSDFVHMIKLLGGKQPIYVLVLVSVAAGIFEEALFRGALQVVGINHYGAIVGIVGSAVLFGLLHFISFQYFVYATVLGIVLGGIYFLSNDLFSLMVAHAVFDFVALYLAMYVYNLDSEETGTAF